MSDYFHPLGNFGRITQGVNDHQKQKKFTTWHSRNAVDISVQAGTPVYAIADGTIRKNKLGPLNSKDPKLAGNRLSLLTNDNEFYYQHLSDLDPAIQGGATVRKGQLLGHSGRAAGVEHLHFAVKNGNPEHILNDAWRPFNVRLQQPSILDMTKTPPFKLTQPVLGNSLPFRRPNYNLGNFQLHALATPTQHIVPNATPPPHHLNLGVPKLKPPEFHSSVPELIQANLGSALSSRRPSWQSLHTTPPDSASMVRLDPSRYNLGIPKLRPPDISHQFKTMSWQPLKLTQPTLGSSLSTRRPSYTLGNFQLRPPKL